MQHKPASKARCKTAVTGNASAGFFSAALVSAGRISAAVVSAALVPAALVPAALVPAALVSAALVSATLTSFVTCDQFAVLAKGAKAAGKTTGKAAGKPAQRIFSLSQDQQHSAAMKMWGVPACVVTGKERPRGLYVTGFTGEGLGNQLGLEIGDVLLSLNGHVIVDAAQADQVLSRTKSGLVSAVVARPSSAPGGISFLTPKIHYAADPSAGGAGSSDTAANSGGVSSTGWGRELSVSELEDYMFNLVNEDRRNNGNIPPLRKSSTLGALARKYAEDMTKRKFFGHDDPDGLNPTGRARREGIHASVWENLATEAGSGNYKYLVMQGERQMMNEPEGEINHRYCILRPQHVAVGIGIAKSPQRVICVQEFSTSELP